MDGLFTRYFSCYFVFLLPAMSSETLKKRKAKVIRSDGGTPETKRGRGEGEQVSGVFVQSVITV